MSAHWCLILNGKSFDARGSHDPVREAVEALRGRGIKIEVRVTWEAGDAQRYAAEAIANGVDCIVAAGGDGSLSAVASVLAENDAPAEMLPALALVPLGTANDFAEAAGIPCEPEAAMELVRTQPAHRIDLLRVRADGKTHWCVNLASGGFGTGTTLAASAGLKRVFGGVAYLISALAELGRIEPEPAHIRGPDFDWQGDFIALGLGNGRLAGGGQALCPEAMVDDGLIDVVLVPDLTGEVGATVARLLTQGKHAALEQVALRARLPWIEMSSPQPITLHLDGEPVQSREFRIECVPGRLRMHLPRDCPLLGDTATVEA